MMNTPEEDSLTTEKNITMVEDTIDCEGDFCNKSTFKISDKGCNPILRLCAGCNSKLCSDLQGMLINIFPDIRTNKIYNKTTLLKPASVQPIILLSCGIMTQAAVLCSHQCLLQLLRLRLLKNCLLIWSFQHQWYHQWRKMQ